MFSQTWKWGCGTGGDARGVQHKERTPDRHAVGPTVWAETRSPYLQDTFLPDFSRRDVLPREAGGLGTYTQIAERVKRMHKQEFTRTPWNEWVHEKGPIFEKLMTGKGLGLGVKHPILSLFHVYPCARYIQTRHPKLNTTERQNPRAPGAIHYTGDNTHPVSYKSFNLQEHQGHYTHFLTWTSAR